MIRRFSTEVAGAAGSMAISTWGNDCSTTPWRSPTLLVQPSSAYCDINSTRFMKRGVLGRLASPYMELKLNRGSIIGLGGDETFEERDVVIVSGID